MGKVILTLKNLDIGYQNTILRSINTKLALGEFNLLLGANGAGKSTLIKTITQQIHPLKGEVSLHQRKLLEYSHLEIAKEIALVSTNNNFDSSLTVKDILSLGRIPYLNFFAQLKKEDLLIIDKYIDLLQLTPLVNNYFNQLSDGQKQKVLIARALIQDTPIIILDEPTAHLDVRNRMLIFSLLKDIAKTEQKAIICATHEIDIALKYASKVWLIDKHQNFIEDDSNKFNSDTVYCNLF